MEQGSFLTQPWGGPKEEYLERARRLKDLNGCPPYTMGAAQPALERLDRHRAEYAVWDGELYLEFRRATLTTQAQMKRVNRRAEEALDAAEKLISAGPAPAAQLDRAWKTVLTNQFNDIIPGSSIHKVYEIAVPEDEAVVATALAAGRRAAVFCMKADAGACTWFNPVIHRQLSMRPACLRPGRRPGALGCVRPWDPLCTVVQGSSKDGT